MKNILLAFIVGFSPVAFAQFHPGNSNSLVQSAARLNAESVRFEQAALYQRLPIQSVNVARRFTRQTEDLLNCLRSGGRGVGGRIEIGRGRIEVGIDRRPGRPSRLCAYEIQETDRDFAQLNRIVYGLPFQSPLVMQLRRVQVALEQVINAQLPGGPAPTPNLVVTGEINRIPFSLQASHTQALENLCLQFGSTRRIYRVETLVANGRVFNLRGASLEQACNIVVREAR